MSQAEFFSDANCTMAISQVSIPAGSSSASFRFKGVTGGINTPLALELSASSPGFTPATQTESILPTVRTGNCAIAAGAVGATCIIGLPINQLDKSFLVFQATNADLTSTEANVRCFLNTTSQVRCDRGKNVGGEVRIQWSVAEFPSGVNVQHKQANCANDLTTVSLSAVGRDRTFLLLSSKRDTNDQGNTIPRIAELTTTTEAEIRKTGGCGSGSVGDTNNLQVVDFPGAVVQRAVTNMQGGSATRQITLSPSVAANRSILLYSWLSDGSGPKVCDRVLRGDITSNGQNIRFSRGEGDAANCSSSGITAISYEVVQFPVGTVVQQVTRQLTGASDVVTLQTPVDASRSLVIAGGQWTSGQVHGEGRHMASELMGEMRARAVLSMDGTTVTLTRDSALASATFTFYVVQLKP
jgi:hypothetical protein